MALALPIAHQLHASAGITALGVMLTGQSFGALLSKLWCTTSQTLMILLPKILTKRLTCMSSSGVGGCVGVTKRGQGGEAIWWR